MKLKTTTVITAAVAIGIICIFLSQGLGLWATESPKEPARFTDVAGFEGKYRADDIRGSYTFAEISSLYGIPLEQLAEAFGVPQEQASEFKCKDLETIYAESAVEIGTGSVKMFVAFYLGQPYTLSESTYVTLEGRQIVETYGHPTQEQLDYLIIHSMGGGAEENLQGNLDTNNQGENTQPETSTNSEGPGSGSGQQGTGEASQQINIKGSTYLVDLAKEYDVPLEDIAAAFGLTQTEAASFQIKDIKNKYVAADVEIGTGSAAMFVAFYKGIEYDISSTNAFFTKDGANVIKEKGKPTAEQLAYLETHTWEE